MMVIPIWAVLVFMAPELSHDVFLTYQEAKAQAGRDPQAHIRLALWCETHGLLAQREKHLAIARLIDPGNAEVRRLLEEPGKQAAEVQSDAELTAARAEYLERRARIPDSADGHWRLALWCEQKGLKAEAIEQARFVVERDPAHEAAWRRLGFKKHNGRRMTDAQVTAEAAAIEAQAKAERTWLPRLANWRDWLARKDKEADARRLLAEVTDPGAVPSVWRIFGMGGTNDQALAVQVLGQIDSAHASRALAVLAAFGKSAEVRRAATETLAMRDPRQYADLLIGLLREPIKYEVQPVGGPGRPGSVTVAGRQFNHKRVYASPPPPNLAIFPGENVSFDLQGRPIIVRNTMDVDLPLFWFYHGYIYPDRNVVKLLSNPIPVAIGQMRAEVSKSANAAQQQLREDVAAIEHTNTLIRAGNDSLTLVLNQATHQNLAPNREAWRAWWAAQIGRTYAPAPEPPRPTAVEDVPVRYLPKRVQGMGYDPDVGYYLWDVPRNLNW
ncbi:MAG TPA: hypothetical protein VGZ22_23585 [Isosphaeraceae bacterium]|nr:hypothetical protein [Isosphaeraceae bacterium]